MTDAPANVFDVLSRRRREIEELAFTVDNARVTSLLLEQMTEIENLTVALTQTHYQDRVYRFHRFDAIKDDMCPCCNGRVVVDESDPERVRIRNVNYQRAS